MLKIKADKMKDLEKMGYVQADWNKDRVAKSYFGISINTKVNSKDYRMLYFKAGNGREYCNKFDELYDLIKADIVEKVVEDGRI